MKTYIFTVLTLIVLQSLSTADLTAQKTNKKNRVKTVDTLNYIFSGSHSVLQINFTTGEEFNHPSFAIWLEDENGEYIETIFVTEYIATGIFGHADAGDGTWSSEKGESIRPAALPYWSHKRNVLSRDSIYMPTPEQPVTDAVTGATPQTNFFMKVNAKTQLPKKFNILMEINQTWDWNEYWTNDKYPDDKYYKLSSQPSVVYAASIDRSQKKNGYTLKPIGHGHYSGNDGSLTTDLSTLTTALEIANQITVVFND